MDTRAQGDVVVSTLQDAKVLHGERQLALARFDIDARPVVGARMYIELTVLNTTTGEHDPDGAIEFFEDFVRFHDVVAHEVERFRLGLFALPENPSVLLSDGAEAFHGALRWNTGSFQGAQLRDGPAPEGRRYFDVLFTSLPRRRQNSSDGDDGEVEAP